MRGTSPSIRTGAPSSVATWPKTTSAAGIIVQIVVTGCRNSKLHTPARRKLGASLLEAPAPSFARAPSFIARVVFPIRPTLLDHAG